MKAKLGKSRLVLLQRAAPAAEFGQAFVKMNNRELSDLFGMTTMDVSAYAEYLAMKRAKPAKQPALKPAPKAPPVMLELAPESINRLADALFDRMVERYQLAAQPEITPPG